MARHVRFNCRFTRRILIPHGLRASLTLAATVPASAQVYFGGGPGGVGVGVGDPDYGWRHRYWRDSYAFDRDDCRVIRERVVTPSGRVIYRSRHICN